MAVVLGTNIDALRAQRQLGKATEVTMRASERLSSGARINRPSDDAASLSVASTLKTDTRVFAQAVRNVNDALSYLAIADHSFGSLENILTRIKELSEQSSNGIYSDKQRTALDSEGKALQAEYNRIIDTTEFNDLKLFTGESSQNIVFQAAYSQLSFSLSVVSTTTDAPSTPGNGVGDGTFYPQVVYSARSGPTYVQAADLNGDSKTDILTVNNGDDSVSVMLGNGNGTFMAQRSYSTPLTPAPSPDPVTARVGDFDGDTKVDIIVADHNAFAHLLIGNGDSTFKADVTVPGGFTANDLEIGDFNGDSKLDYVVDNDQVDNLSVYFGVGNGTFVNGPTLTAMNMPYGVKAADLNGDAKLDIITSSTDYWGLYVFMGTGDGTFSAMKSYEGSPTFPVEVGDFTGDGKVDIINMNSSTGALQLLPGNGNGTFTSPQIFAPGTNTTNIHFGDFNGDSKLDLITSTEGTDILSVHIGNGNGTFKAKTNLSTGDKPKWVDVADLNGDGISDLVSANNLSNNVSVLLGNGTISGGSGGGGGGTTTTVSLARLTAVDLTTRANSLATLDLSDSKLQEILLLRGNVGASESRFMAALATLETARVQFAGAHARIMDADVATESAILVQGNILQQTAAAVLSQANLNPRLALSLLE